MFDRGHVFRLFSRLPAHFASQSDAPVGAPDGREPGRIDIFAIAEPAEALDVAQGELFL